METKVRSALDDVQARLNWLGYEQDSATESAMARVSIATRSGDFTPLPLRLAA